MTSNVMETIDRPFREVGFREPSVEIERRGDGTLILKSGPPLPPTRACTTDWLEHWVTVRPDSPMLAQRNRAGAWDTWSIREVWNALRSLATALLSLGASQSAPLVILSENSAAQALLTWGALYAGVPVAPVSPAYSLLGGGGGHYRRLIDAVSLVKPHLVFVEDAQRYEGALAALGVPPERVIAVEHTAPGMLSSRRSPAHPSARISRRGIANWRAACLRSTCSRRVLRACRRRSCNRAATSLLRRR